MLDRRVTWAVVVWAGMLSAAWGQGEFPKEWGKWVAYGHNSVFKAKGEGWEVKLRERGWILKEANVYRMWYTGYDGTREGKKQVGYALSSDGLHWTRHPENPIFGQLWTEDMMVVKHDGTYYMFAEGEQDIAHLLTSKDGMRWQPAGPLDIRLADGKPIPPGPRGTPAVWVENGTWYLYYERRDAGIWLATSRDLKVWTNVQDKPVIALGPDKYDQHAVAMNQIIKHEGKYYGVYHASDSDQPGRLWTTNLAVSDDLIHWRKHPKNPILGDNKSSGLLIHDGTQFRLYTMHDTVQVHFPTADK